VWVCMGECWFLHFCPFLMVLRRSGVSDALLVSCLFGNSLSATDGYYRVAF
jgi:hypothetical protein